MKKKALGKGLGALMGERKIGRIEPASQGVPGTPGAAGKEVIAVAVGARTFTELATENIVPSRNQPRKVFEEAPLFELSESIKEQGIIEPLIVRKIDGGKFELIAGERRWRASQMAELKKVPAVVMDVDDRETLEMAIVENIQREDLNAIEEAESFKNLMSFGLTQEEVAKKVGKQRATVSNYIRILSLPHDIKQEVLNGSVSFGHARAILSLDTSQAQRALCKKIIKEGLSVRHAEKLARLTLTGGSSPKRPSEKMGAVSRDLQILEEDLSKILGTRVKVKDRKGKGKIEIDFYSVDERERIIDNLRNIGL